MALEKEVLCKSCEILESRELHKIEFSSASVSTLDVVLQEVHSYFCPNPTEYKQRNRLVDTVNEMVKCAFGNINGYPLVEAFGSFIMDMFSTQSDLDLSINLNSDQSESLLPHDKKINILKKFVKVLQSRRKGMFHHVQPILSARVPIVKFVDCASGIECDVSVENKDAITKSFVILTISSIDERFKILSCLMKIWAKTYNINSSKDHTLNSLSIILLVVFHLQTRDPPILPPLSAILKGGTDHAVLRDIVGQFKHFGKSNTETVAELFIALLYKLSSVETLWEKGLCASAYEGSWISKTWGSKIGIMSVEDFSDRSQNCARAVSKGKFTIIYKRIWQTVELVSHFCKGQTEASNLKALMFAPFTPCVRKKAKKKSKSHKRKSQSNDPTTLDSSNPPKRANKSKNSKDNDRVSEPSQSNRTCKKKNRDKEKANMVAMVSPRRSNHAQDSIASQVQHHRASSSQMKYRNSNQNNSHLHQQYHPQQLSLVPSRLNHDLQRYGQYHPQHQPISLVPYGHSYMPGGYQHQIPYIPSRNWYQQPQSHPQPQLPPTHHSYRRSYGYGPRFWQPPPWNPSHSNYRPY